LTSCVRFTFSGQQSCCPSSFATTETHSLYIYDLFPQHVETTPAKMSTHRWNVRMALGALYVCLLGLLSHASAQTILCSEINTSSMSKSKHHITSSQRSLLTIWLQIPPNSNRMERVLCSAKEFNIQISIASHTPSQSSRMMGAGARTTFPPAAT
jgi:hypothetical protein